MPFVRPTMMRAIKFTCDTTEYAGEVSEVTITGDVPTSEWKTLDPDSSGKDIGTPTYSMTVAGFADHETADGFHQFLLTNVGESVAFEFEPALGKGKKYSGSFIGVPPAIGGSVDNFSTFSITVPLTSPPVVTAVVAG